MYWSIKLFFNYILFSQETFLEVLAHFIRPRARNVSFESPRMKIGPKAGNSNVSSSKRPG